MTAIVGTCPYLHLFHLLLIGFLGVVASSASYLDCVSVCFFFCFLIRLSSICSFVSLLSARWSHNSSFPSFVTLCICLLTICQSVLFSSFTCSFFVCVVSFALCLSAFCLRCFSFSVSVFLQLSEFLSFCKSLCPFLSFFYLIAHECIHVHVWASVCVCACRVFISMLGYLRWCVCFTPDARVLWLNVWFIFLRLSEVWNIFQRWNIFLFWEVF